MTFEFKHPNYYKKLYSGNNKTNIKSKNNNSNNSKASNTNYKFYTDICHSYLKLNFDLLIRNFNSVKREI